MWLADAVAAYVERLNEREFDAPFIALLHRLGYTDVHLTHGQFELGKDFIARRHEDGVEHQWCFQSKAGDIKSNDLRVDVLPQVQLMRTGRVVHPQFDPDLPRRIVVVTTGRLKGTAGVEFQQNEDYHRERGEVAAELWDIDFLVPSLVETLVTTNDLPMQGRILEMVGRLQGGRGNRSDISSLASHWLAPGDTDKANWRDALTACLLANTASTNAREDLAQQATWQLIRAHYRAVERGDTPDPAILDVAHSAFDAIATDLWDQIRAEPNPVHVTMGGPGGASPYLTHPIKVARLCETLSILALARIEARSVASDTEDTDDTDDVTPVIELIEQLLSETPALSHLVGDEWTFSLMVTVVALSAAGRAEAAADIVRTAMVWVLDLVEDGILLPRVGAPAHEVVNVILATAYNSPQPIGTKHGYGFAVLTDLAALLADLHGPTADTEDLYADFVHDLDALRAMGSLTVPVGVEAGRHIARVEYFDQAPRANHHKAEVINPWPVASKVDSLQVWGTFRDRHIFEVLQRLAAPASYP